MNIFRPFFAGHARMVLASASILLIGSSLLKQAVAQNMGQMDRRPALAKLNDKAAEARVKANDPLAARGLIEDVLNSTVFAASPETIRDRLARAEHQFRTGKHKPISEAGLANAVDQLAASLGAPSYNKTSGDQVRIFRMLLLMMAPRLLGSPTPAPLGKAIADDLTPSGAAFLGLALLHQKLINPDYQVTADEWVKRMTTPPAQIRATTAPSNQLTIVKSPSPELKAFVDKLKGNLAVESGAPAASLHLFFDNVGFQR